MQRMTITTPPPDSAEALLASVMPQPFMLLFNQQDREHQALNQVIGHRAIGVIYNPQQDHRQYVPTILPRRYDGLIFVPETRALSPLLR